VCGDHQHRPAFRSGTRSLDQIDPNELAPAASAFGTTLGDTVSCRSCGHGSLRGVPSAEELARTYAHVEDHASLDEEAGQVATARRDLRAVRALLTDAPGDLLDIGCWTGSLLDAARTLGWDTEGIEPSDWAAARAEERGHPVAVGTLGEVALRQERYQVIACCDVLEHLVDPGDAVARIAALLEPGGLLFATVPDAGSRLARALGHRWWSVLPMHVQYFTRSSLRSLLSRADLEVLSVRTHPKVFTRGYYADRLGEFVPGAGRPLERLAAIGSWADRPFAPDLRDRMAVIARRPVEEQDR
jgi:2-polyprenyl-3-methyl-5-hydroxy-6-metoxy-1,4-benzoquinol methylase